MSIEPKDPPQGDLLASAVPALVDDGVPFGWPSSGEWGRSSNTPPPTATPATSSGSSTPAVVCLPVVADTIYVTFSAPTNEWARVVCAKAEDRPHFTPHWLSHVDGEPRVLVGKKGEVPPPDVFWTILRGTRDGFHAYRWTIDGVGPYHGVHLLVGDMPRAVAAMEPSVRNCLLQIGSAVLWMARGQGKNLADTVRWILRSITGIEAGVALIKELPTDERVKPNRIDLCCDHWGYDWKPHDLHRFATRIRYNGEITSQARRDALNTENRQQFGSEHPTLYLGSRSSETRQLRIYLKTEEASKRGKLPWLEPIWSCFGWKPGMRVWRAEVQFGGGWLRSHGMRTLVDMENAERSLWEHYTSTVRHTTGQATRKRRDVVSEVWRALGSASTTLEAGCWEWTPRKASGDCDLPHLVRMIAGCLLRVESELFDGPAALQAGDPGCVAPWRAPAPLSSADRHRAAMQYVLDQVAAVPAGGTA